MTEAPGGDTSPRLDYAPPPPLHRRRIWRRALLGVTLVALALLAWRLWPDLRPRIEFLALQRKCMIHTWPADTVVFEQTAADTLHTQPGGSRTWPPKFTPSSWERYINSHVATPNGTTYFQSQGTPFLHARTTSSGTRRLIALDTQLIWHDDNTLLRVHVRLIKPGSFASPKGTDVLLSNYDRSPYLSPLPSASGARVDLARIPYGTAFRLFGGQADPRDPSHFTLDYESDGVRGVIDGRLLDGDAVKLTFRPSPATRSFRPRLPYNPPP